MVRSRRLLVACSLISGCTGAPEGAAPSPAPPAKADAPVAAPETKVGTAAAAPETKAPETTAPEATAPETTAATGAPPAGEGPTGRQFWLAATRQGDLLVADLGDELVVGGAAVLARAGADGTLERMNTLGGLVDPGSMELTGWELAAIGGRWPDPVWMHTRMQYQRATGAPYMYYRKGERWQRKATKVGLLHWYYHSFAPWSEGRTLALRQMTAEPAMPAGDGEVSPALKKKLDAALAAEPPRLDVLVAGAAPAPSPLRLAAGSPVSFTALPSGEVFVLLAQSEGEGEDAVARYVVQRFAAGDTVGVVDELRESGGKRFGLHRGVFAARSADTVYLGGAALSDEATSALLLRFFGGAWAPVPAPKAGEVSSLAVAGDGALWAVAELAEPTEDGPTSGVWRRAGEGAWKPVPLPRVDAPERRTAAWHYVPMADEWKERPADAEAAAELDVVDPRQVLARGDEVWISATRAGHISADGLSTAHVVLRSKPVRRVLDLPDDATLRAELLAAQPAKPWKEGEFCESGSTWVRVATLADADPPETAQRLHGELVAGVPEELRARFESLREAEVLGRRVVGLIATPEDAAQAKAVIAALDKLRPGEKRAFECRNPRPLRVVKF